MFSNKSLRVLNKLLFGSLIKEPFGSWIKETFGYLTGKKIIYCGEFLKQMLMFKLLRRIFWI